MHTRCVRVSVAWMCVFASVAVVGAVSECLTEGPNVRVSLNSNRNETGHWISQVTLHHNSEHKSKSESRQVKPWFVDVEHNTNRCSGSVAYDVVLTFITQPSVVGTDYTLYPGIGYYKFHEDVATWPRAREICAEEGAHLVIINSEQESDVTKKLFARYPKVTGASDNHWAWVGAKEVDGVHGQYVTIYDVPLNKTGFTRWDTVHPNKPSQGDYLLVSRGSGGLADQSKNAGWKLPFICEQELW